MYVNSSIEYFDVLDENGNKTGKVKTKENIIKDRDFYRIVNLWIINPNTKQILIQKRSNNKDVSPNKWDLTSGGHVEAGETSLEAIIRETKEELGIDISNDKILKVFEVKYDKMKRNFVDVYLLEKDVSIKDIKLQYDEVSDVRYFSLEELIRAHNTKDTNFVNHSFFPDIVEQISNIYKI
ncbi:MAG: NUDIX domain-containing protein [Bacilli bacterium]|nr:NUDIX domain-containing protein [Bacilli bacterium]